MLGQKVIDDDCLAFLQHVVGGEDVATKAATDILTMGLKESSPGDRRVPKAGRLRAITA
jgi:hypothetical protein